MNHSEFENPQFSELYPIMKSLNENYGKLSISEIESLEIPNEAKAVLLSYHDLSFVNGLHLPKYFKIGLNVNEEKI